MGKYVIKKSIQIILLGNQGQGHCLQTTAYSFLLSYPFVKQFHTNDIHCNKHIKKHHSVCKIVHTIYSDYIYPIISFSNTKSFISLGHEVFSALPKSTLSFSSIQNNSLLCIGPIDYFKHGTFFFYYFQVPFQIIL